MGYELKVQLFNKVPCVNTSDIGLVTQSKGLCTDILLIAVLKSIMCISDFITVNNSRININFIMK
jgi:hypothetical protein